MALTREHTRLDLFDQTLDCQLLRHSADAPWLVFLHEGLGSIALWRDTPETIAEAVGANALVYSRHGYGRSSRLARPRVVAFMEHEAEHVLPALLAHFNITAPILVGHSDGGSIALLYAALADSRAKGVIAMAPHTFVEDKALKAIAQARQAFLAESLRDRLAAFHDDVDGAFFGWNDIWLDPLFATWDVRSRMAQIRCPAVIIQGYGDEYGTMAQVDEILARVSHAHGLKLPDCRHAPHRDQPEAVRAAVARLVAEVCGGSPRGVRFPQE